MRAVLIPLLMLACLLAACPRGEAPPAGQRLGGATHPWEQPGYTPLGGQKAKPETNQPEATGQVVLPAQRGPAFTLTDTLNPEYLPGEWLQVCYVAKERMDLVPAAEQDVLELGPTGQALFHHYEGGELRDTSSGTWQKLRPGVLNLGFGKETATEVYAEFYGRWFLYIWNYDVQTGMWFARMPEDRQMPPLGTDYETTRGKMHIAEVVNNSFTGTVAGVSQMQIRGFCNAGVVSLRWEDAQNNAVGFAAFRADPQSGVLYGVWWVDNYTSAPFGGSWEATPPSAAPLPEDVQGKAIADQTTALDSQSAQAL